MEIKTALQRVLEDMENSSIDCDLCGDPTGAYTPYGDSAYTVDAPMFCRSCLLEAMPEE